MIRSSHGGLDEDSSFEIIYTSVSDAFAASMLSVVQVGICV
jgi:hypothetical protein